MLTKNLMQNLLTRGRHMFAKIEFAEVDRISDWITVQMCGNMRKWPALSFYNASGPFLHHFGIVYFAINCKTDLNALYSNK